MHYDCPIDGRPVSEAVHRARLRRGTPACRDCAHRAEGAAFAPSRTRRLDAVWSRKPPEAHVVDDTLVCEDCNAMAPLQAERLAAAFAARLRQDGRTSDCAQRVAIGYDGRPVAWELLESIARGIRRSGSDALDLGHVSLPCWHFALGEAEAGIYLGRPLERPGAIGLTFAASGPLPPAASTRRRRPQAPLSREAIADLVQRTTAALSRPTRRGGHSRRVDAATPYLEQLSYLCHGLRPLRIVLGSSDTATKSFLTHLLRNTAVERFDCPPLEGRVRNAIRDRRADFGARVTENGRCCTIYDDRLRPVPVDRLLMLLANFLTAERTESDPELSTGESGAASRVVFAAADRKEPLPVSPSGSRLRWALCAPTSRGLAEAMCLPAPAVVGGDTAGRLWFPVETGGAHPDALRAILSLLRVLSQSDRPLSTVLDDGGRVD